MEKRQSDGTLYGVDCEVRNCLYHGSDNMCHADNIQVETQTNYCDSETETFCGTFKADNESY